MLSTFLFKYIYRLKPVEYPDPNGTLPKSVLMMAPHTSIMDFVFGLAACKNNNVNDLAPDNSRQSDSLTAITDSIKGTIKEVKEELEATIGKPLYQVI